MPYKRKYLDPRIVDQYNDRHFGGVGGKYVLERELAILNHLMGNIQSGLFLDIPVGQEFIQITILIGGLGMWCRHIPTDDSKRQTINWRK